MRKGICRESSCQAEVLFVVTINDKNQIVDAKPEKRIVLFDGISGKVIANKDELEAASMVAPRAKVVDTYVDHHATCTNAKRFKKPLEVIDGGKAIPVESPGAEDG